MINNQNCFAVNFGFSGEIPFPTITLTKDVQQSLEMFGFDRLYRCFYVLVGGKYADHMVNLLDVVEGVTDKFHGIKPIALFLMGKYDTDRINELSKQSRNMTMVQNNNKIAISLKKMRVTKVYSYMYQGPNGKHAQ